MSACNDQQDVIDADNTQSLKISAQLSQTAISRSYQEDGPVEGGTFYLTYPDKNNANVLAYVNFGVEGTNPAIGIVKLPSNNNNTELIWDKIGGGTTPTFYLDNVPLEKSDPDNPIIVTFSDEYKPFIAGVFDEEEGTNDLLWSSKAETRGVNNLNFDLHHNMARLKVIVTVDKSNSADETALDLKYATVSISNLILEPVSYNRTDGTLSLGENLTDTNFKLVSPDGNKWKFEPEESDDNLLHYITRDFVLPPQNLLEDSNRPRLTITLSNGRTYSGVIPYAMTVIDSTYPEPGYPMTLSFLKEHILTIHTVVTEDPPELSFMPVYVVEWVDKGNFSLDGHQAGIYSASEFYSMIEYYNYSDEASRNYQLQRYGTNSDNSWNFVLWNTITLEFTQIAGRMVPENGKPEFSFSFSGYGVYILNRNESKKVEPDQLIKIVKGSLTWESLPSN